MHKCECGCTDFIVRFRQISTYEACIDINSDDLRWDGTDEEIESVDVDEQSGYVCENCGRFYEDIEDMPEDDDDEAV